MKVQTNQVFNKIAVLQLILLLLVGLATFYIQKYSIASAFFISAIVFPLYTQLLKLSGNKMFLILLGLPFRLIFIGIVFAILIHKFHINLIALFTGFGLSQLIYFICMFKYANKQMKNSNL